MPIISPHGHVPRVDRVGRPRRRPDLLLSSRTTTSPGSMHAHGVALESLGAGGTPLTRRGPGRLAALCTTGKRSAGRRAVTGWKASSQIFGVTVRPSADHRRRDLDQVARPCRARLPARALLDRFGTRCWPDRRSADDLAHHAAIRTTPRSRPGCCHVPPRPSWSRHGGLGRSWSTPSHRRQHRHRTYKGFIAAMEDRRRHFTATVPSPPTTATTTPAHRPLDQADGERIFGWPARARRPGRGHRRCAGTCCWRWRGCRSRTAW